MNRQPAIYEARGHVPAEWGGRNVVDEGRRTVEFLEPHLRPGP